MEVGIDLRQESGTTQYRVKGSLAFRSWARRSLLERGHSAGRGHLRGMRSSTEESLIDEWTVEREPMKRVAIEEEDPESNGISEGMNFKDTAHPGPVEMYVCISSILTS